MAWYNYDDIIAVKHTGKNIKVIGVGGGGSMTANYIYKKIHLNSSKIHQTINKFGNTASVSVPLTIVSELKEKLKGRKKLMLNAFGVGMAWSTAIVPFVDCKISDIVEI